MGGFKSVVCVSLECGVGGPEPSEVDDCTKRGGVESTVTGVVVVAVWASRKRFGGRPFRFIATRSSGGKRSASGLVGR